jgi:biotin synthase
VIATARIMMPKAYVRLSAGRAQMSDEMQALAFFAGANAIFYGDCLLTTPNPAASRDQQLFDRLGLHSAPGQSHWAEDTDPRYFELSSDAD